MRNFWLILSVLWLWTCSGGDKATGPEEPPIVINLTSLGGQAQKGPFNNGTAINIAELTNTLSPTGRNFSSAITDNTGRFAVANVQLESPYVELRANGFYFNEVSNNISDAQLTLYALSDLTGKTSLNVNILTHLEKNRMITLMSGDNPKTFAQAKLQAQEEVLAIFGYSRTNMPASELLDISQGGAANAKLLAISAILQGNQTVGKMSEILANISTDITPDGTLENTTIENTLINNAANLDFEQIRSNLSARFTALGITATIPDFESEINQFLKPPVANNINVSTDEDNPINITLDASDPEGESLTFQIVETNNATVNINGNIANYTPDANFNGTDTFTYFANDGTVNSNTATVTITVGAVDDDPNTNDVAITTDEDTEVVFTLSADEYDGDSYSFALITQPSNGSASLDGSSVTYTPNTNWNGTDTFTFEATDDTGRTMNVARASITINPVNDAPFAPDITIDMVEDGTGQFIISSAASDANFFRINATDIENDALTFQAISVNNATYVLVDNNNELAYYPNQDFNGQDTFQYTVSDGTDESNTGTITVNIAGVNDPPQALDITVDSIYEDTAHNFLFEEGMIGENTGGFTGIDVDNNPYSGQTLDFILVSQPSNGNLSIDGSTISIGDLLNDKSSSSGLNILYTPNNNFYGTDSFTYKSNDGELDSNNVGTATITFVPVNDAPTAVAVSKTMDEDGGTIDVETNYNDVDGDTDLTFTLVDAPLNGTATVGIPGTYTPNANFHGTDTFTYTVSDDEYTSDPATVTITVKPVYDSNETDLTSSQLEFGEIFEDINSDNMLNVDYNNNKITLFDRNLNILSSYQFSSDVTPYWAISKADGSWVIITDNDEDSVNGTSMWSVSWYGFDSSLSLSSQSEEFMVPSYSTISFDAYFLPNGNLLINGIKRCTDDPNSCTWEPVIIESDSQGQLVQYITEFDNESITTKLFMKDSYYFLLAGNKIFEMDFDGNVTNSFNTPSNIPSFNIYNFPDESIDGGYAILSNQLEDENRFFNINKNPKQRIFSRFSSMRYDITLTKFDSDFNQEWFSVLDINSNGSSYDQATRLIQDQADGNYYALGRTIYNFVDFSDYQFDIFIAKFDVNGSNIFSSTFGNDSFHDIPKLISFNEYNQLSIFALKYTDPKESWIFKIDKDGVRTDKTF